MNPSRARISSDFPPILQTGASLLSSPEGLKVPHFASRFSARGALPSCDGTGQMNGGISAKGKSRIRRTLGVSRLGKLRKQHWF